MKLKWLFKKFNALLRVLLISVLVMVMVVVWTLWSNPIPEGMAQACFKNDRCVDLVGVMDTNELRAQGLMGREPLGEDEGMLFVFPKAIETTFWMKNVTFPIDIVWFDTNKRIVCVEKKVPPCETEECPTYPCGFKAKYVVELPSGFAEEYLLYENDWVEFKGTVYD